MCQKCLIQFRPSSDDNEQISTTTKKKSLSRLRYFDQKRSSSLITFIYLQIFRVSQMN